MRRLCVLLSAVFVVWAQSAAASEPAEEIMSYPGAVALSQDATGGWVYKSFPQLLPLYIFKGEPAGRSLCAGGCTAIWPILRARSDDKPVGSWTVVKRDDGRLQWAYKNSPVYTYFEDRPSASEPRGVGKNMDWYLDERANAAYLESVGVKLPGPLVYNQKPRNIEATSELLQP